MPEDYEWALSLDRSYLLPNSYVYHRDLHLEDGRTYHFQTRNLRALGYANADPVMYLVRGHDIVQFNDDYTDLASEIIYTPTTVADIDTPTASDIHTATTPDLLTPTDTYRLVIRAYATATPGLCDLYQGVDGAAPALLESNVMFGGTYVRVRWKQGEWFETGLSSLYFSAGFGGGGQGNSDPYLFLIYPESAVGSQMYWDDDGAGFPDSKLVPPSGGTGTLILGAFSRYTGGTCRLALVGQSYKAPWMSPAPWASVAEPVALTPTLTKYIEELERQKPALDKLSPEKRDEQVLELQRRTLSEEEIRRQIAPMPAVSPELVRRQELFLERYGQMEKDLARMSYGERAANLAHVKREAMGREYSEPESPLLPDDEADDSDAR